ncbi:MAG: 4-alpha-glucanotransferase, partial [Lachnospiraceae bacterium]|nr:4-alpha-glucanotransferase [Lachnospiraceae bacterium]
LDNISKDDRKMVEAYLNEKGADKKHLVHSLVRLALASVADRCVIPMQDYLGYDNSARMNQPSTVGINWRWRITEEEMPEKLQKDIRTLTRRFGRLSHQWQKELDETK